MKKKRISYSNPNWIKFREIILRRDNYKCVKCGRDKDDDTVLQVHHIIYKPNLLIWEYATSDCITLCKGCHAREHNILKPTEGWTLISIGDLGEASGNCERKSCGAEIRYEHEVYHPNWGYMNVGSVCVDFLTKEEQWLSKESLKIYKRISFFIKKSIWEKSYNPQFGDYIYTHHSHHRIEIYGKEGNYCYRINLKKSGLPWYEETKLFLLKNKTIEQVKELAYIALKGITCKDIKQKKILRNIYINIKKN